MADLAVPTTHADAIPAKPKHAARSGVNWARVVMYAILITATIVALLPFFWMLSTSLMTLGETINRKWLPDVPQVENYVEAWNQAKFVKYFTNSVIITLTTTIGMLTTSTLAAY